MRLAKQVAIVTGAGSGIGRATAIRFAQEGAQVVVDDINVSQGEATVKQIRDSGGDALFIGADVSDPEAVESLVVETVQTYGQLNILVNNAICSVKDIQNNNWDPNLNIAVKGASHCINAAIPRMRQSSGGSIINISSVNGLVGLQGIHAYSASKGAIIALTRSLATSHGKDNIRINCICPGTIVTEAWDTVAEKNPEIFDELRPWYALKRLGKPGDIANAALFLASEEASFATGAVFVIDGGLTGGHPQFPF